MRERARRLKHTSPPSPPHPTAQTWPKDPISVLRSSLQAQDALHSSDSPRRPTPSLPFAAPRSEVPNPRWPAAGGGPCGAAEGSPKARYGATPAPAAAQSGAAGGGSAAGGGGRAPAPTGLRGRRARRPTASIPSLSLLRLRPLSLLCSGLSTVGN